MMVAGATIAAVLLISFLIWKEMKRRARRHLALRIIASILAVTALTALVWQPHYGANAPAAKDRQSQHQGGTQPAGFTASSWPRQVYQGQWLEVQGQYHNPGNDTLRVTLTGLGSRFDSVTIAPAAIQSFQLRCKPSYTGNTLYELETSDGTIEKLPVQVLPAQSLQVLLLSSSPGFENKFLLSFLHDHRYTVAVRNAISRNKYSRQFLNSKGQPLQPITAGLLQTFDVLICDNQELAALSPAEKAVLRQQVENGLGIILQTDSTALSAPFNNGWQLARQPGIPAAARPLHVPAGHNSTAPLQPDQWISIRSNPAMQPLVTDNEGAVVAAAALYGYGKLVVNTVNNTYSWVLGGHEPDHARFWSHLLQKAARRSQQAINWQTISAYPTVNHPVTIVMESTRSGLPAIETRDGPLAASQLMHLPNTWTATWWPVHPGWQSIWDGADSLPVFVFNNSDWKTARAAQAMTVNQQESAVRNRKLASKEHPANREKRRVQPVIFWAVFLLAGSYLWWEEKRALG